MFIEAAVVLHREITVGLDEWTWGWDGVLCISQHGVGDKIAGTGWGWEIF